MLHVPQGATRLFLETSCNLSNSLKSGHGSKFFEIRTPPIQRAFRTAEVDILTTAVIRQDFYLFKFLEIITIVTKQDFDFLLKLLEIITILTKQGFDFFENF